MQIADLEVGVAKYIKDEVAPNIPNTLQRFTLYTGSFLIAGKTERLIEKYMPTLKAMDIIDDSGEIDVDILYKAAKEGMAATGTVEYKGMIFNSKDVDSLYKYIKGEVKKNVEKDKTS